MFYFIALCEAVLHGQDTLGFLGSAMGSQGSGDPPSSLERVTVQNSHPWPHSDTVSEAVTHVDKAVEHFLHGYITFVCFVWTDYGHKSRDKTVDLTRVEILSFIIPPQSCTTWIKSVQHIIFFLFQLYCLNITHPKQCMTLVFNVTKPPPSGHLGNRKNDQLGGCTHFLFYKPVKCYWWRRRKSNFTLL